MRFDWQTLVTLAIGLVAALYLARRWWPGLRNLFSKAPPAPTSGTACHAQQGPSPAASCGSGCGNCGHPGTPAKDHRIQVIRPRQG